MNELISVIVPVYNVERYLSKCIESILGQSYENLEIILIDDGSTDCSGEICDKYAKLDNRIIVIHKENGGASSAKNAGLRIANGKYLSFVDSDDYLEPCAYLYMISKLNEYHADVIHCCYRDIYVNFSKDRVSQDFIEKFGTEEYLRRFTTDWSCGLLWNKLYRRKIFQDIYFEEGHKIDDEFFTYQGIMNAEEIIYCPKVIYNYRKRESSVMVSVESQKQILMDKLDYLQQRRIKISTRFPALKQDFDHHFLSMLLILSMDNAVTFEGICEIQRLLRVYFNQKDFCKMEWSLCIKLIKLMHSRPQAVLNRKKLVDLSRNQYQYFE